MARVFAPVDTLDSLLERGRWISPRLTVEQDLDQVPAGGIQFGLQYKSDRYLALVVTNRRTGLRFQDLEALVAHRRSGPAGAFPR